MEQPSSTVISAAAIPSAVNFTCSAEGAFPCPRITWTHGGHNISSSDKYEISNTLYPTSSGRQGITSTLTISDLRAQDTAMVGCHADIHFSEDLQLPGDDVIVPLSVLGKMKCSENA